MEARAFCVQLDIGYLSMVIFNAFELQRANRDDHHVGVKTGRRLPTLRDFRIRNSSLPLPIGIVSSKSRVLSQMKSRAKSTSDHGQQT